MGRADRAALLSSLDGDESPLALLARLFLLGGPIARAPAQRLLGPRVPELLEPEADDRLRSPVLLEPFAGLVLASDPWTHGRGRPDTVCPVTAAARTLSRLTVRRRAGLALDLGTGCGVQGLLAARHSSEVVLTDVNPRALEFAQLNERLNGIRNCRRVQGSWFEPVAGDSFDLIIANPPFVISPDSSYEYRDAALPGDDVSRELVRAAPEHLAEGGFAHMLVNWVHEPDGDWAAPLRDWVGGRGCDALLFRFQSPPLVQYAALWNQDERAEGARGYAAAVSRWLAYYRERGIRAVGAGAIVLRRRRAGTPWVQALEMPHGSSAAESAHLELMFANGERLAADGSDAWLLATTLAPAQGLRVEQSLTFGERRWSRHVALARRVPGLGLQALVEPDALGVLLRCDGRRTLAELLEDAGDELRGEVLGAARDLLARGLLELAA